MSTEVVAFVTKKWEGVGGAVGALNKHHWEFSLLHEARTALHVEDLTVEGSQVARQIARHKNPDVCIDGENTNSRRWKS